MSFWTRFLNLIGCKKHGYTLYDSMLLWYDVISRRKRTLDGLRVHAFLRRYTFMAPFMGVAMVCIMCTQSCYEGPGDLIP